MADTQTPWWSWLAENRWPWEAPSTTGEPIGVYKGKWAPFSKTGMPLGKQRYS